MEDKKKINTKPSKIVIFISILLILINSSVSYILGGGSIPYVLGNVFLMPIIIIAISSIFKVYRNWRSRWIIILNTMLIVSLSLFGNIVGNYTAYTSNTPLP